MKHDWTVDARVRLQGDEARRLLWHGSVTVKCPIALPAKPYCIRCWTRATDLNLDDACLARRVDEGAS